jgi:hypothetical protein
MLPGWTASPLLSAVRHGSRPRGAIHVFWRPPIRARAKDRAAKERLSGRPSSIAANARDNDGVRGPPTSNPPARATAAPAPAPSRRWPPGRQRRSRSAGSRARSARIVRSNRRSLGAASGVVGQGRPRRCAGGGRPGPGSQTWLQTIRQSNVKGASAWWTSCSGTPEISTCTTPSTRRA